MGKGLKEDVRIQKKKLVGGKYDTFNSLCEQIERKRSQLVKSGGRRIYRKTG